MNPLREAAVAMHEAEQKHAGLRFLMDVSHKYVHITANLGELEMSRSASWEEIEAGRINVLTAHVALIISELTAQAA